jgi:hypothetical protein
MCPRRRPEARQYVSAPVAGVGVAGPASCPRKAARLRAGEVVKHLADGRCSGLILPPPRLPMRPTRPPQSPPASSVPRRQVKEPGKRGALAAQNASSPEVGPWVAGAGSCPRKLSKDRHEGLSKPAHALSVVVG